MMFRMGWMAVDVAVLRLEVERFRVVWIACGSIRTFLQAAGRLNSNSTYEAVLGSLERTSSPLAVLRTLFLRRGEFVPNQPS